MQIQKLTAGKKRLLDFLGNPYRDVIIDMERCVYLDMVGHDIEISGGRTAQSAFDIFVWCKLGQPRIVETHWKVPSELPRVRELLDDIRSRYSSGCSDSSKKLW